MKPMKPMFAFGYVEKYEKWRQHDNWFFCWCRELFHSCGTAPKNFASALSASAWVRLCHWGRVLGVKPSLHLSTGCALAFMAAGNLIGIQDWHSAPICLDSPLVERPWIWLNNLDSSRENITDIHKSHIFIFWMISQWIMQRSGKANQPIETITWCKAKWSILALDLLAPNCWSNNKTQSYGHILDTIDLFCIWHSLWCSCSF